ncbi:Glu/Leu/Phe/Val dehydrogenase [bacterium]|nr:Glu/Leu/Phe/Val dehydrogenase [bacterium]
MPDFNANAVKIIDTKSHEKVFCYEDPDLKYQAIIALHSTKLGPAAGGCRLRHYDSFADALYDALRLAEGMSYKNSLAGIPYGGGKAVIIPPVDPNFDRKKLFQSFGKFVASLAGKYYTAEDMGTSVPDIVTVSETCQYVIGMPKEQGGCGDPSPYTALGVYHGMRAAVENVYGVADLKNRTVMIQGAGHVGYYLAQILAAADAKILIADTHPERAEVIVKEFKATAVSSDDVFNQRFDIFAPCAVGGILNDRTATLLNCSIIAGGANNQLSEPGVEQILNKRNILYTPDFAVNAGGIIACVDQHAAGGFNDERVKDRVKKIYDTIKMIYKEASLRHLTPGQVANKLAEERIHLSQKPLPTGVTSDQVKSPMAMLYDLPM